MCQSPISLASSNLLSLHGQNTTVPTLLPVFGSPVFSASLCYFTTLPIVHLDFAQIRVACLVLELLGWYITVLYRCGTLDGVLFNASI
jgi:hypothetical protein